MCHQTTGMLACWLGMAPPANDFYIRRYAVDTLASLRSGEVMKQTDDSRSYNVLPCSAAARVLPAEAKAQPGHLQGPGDREGQHGAQTPRSLEPSNPYGCHPTMQPVVAICWVDILVCLAVEGLACCAAGATLPKVCMS